jgi:hypothetical protein
LKQQVTGQEGKERMREMITCRMRRSWKELEHPELAARISLGDFPAT